METEKVFQIITFYEFKDMAALGDLVRFKLELRETMAQNDIKGTIILADEGFNSTVCGTPENIGRFIDVAEEILQTELRYKSSFHVKRPFRRIDVKIKPEIVTLKKPADVSKGEGTHVKPSEWNRIISDPETVVLDTRNDYEFRNGSFRRALNPKTEKFSELPSFVTANLDRAKHKKIAMYCTGGIRCEKFAPFMKSLGFEEIYQLDGGILKYLEDVPREEQLWDGECFVFDDRVTVDHKLEKGSEPDLSQNKDKKG